MNITEGGAPSLKPPVALFAFRRPHHTSRVLDAIREYAPERLYLIADGPRLGNPQDNQLCEETRLVLSKVDWECEVIRLYADENLGLKRRVTSGLDFVFDREEAAVILEDDCIPSQDFFKFCAYGLSKYSDNEEVALISGNNFNPVPTEANRYFFLSEANIWGWATWSRTWKKFRDSGYLEVINQSEKRAILECIPVASERRRFNKMLGGLENLDSWAVPFSAFVYRRALLSAAPGANLVTNVGMGLDSTHTKFESYVDEMRLGHLNWPLSSPTFTQIDLEKSLSIARHRRLRWITYPLKHPLDFMGRVFRFVSYLIRSNS